MKVFRQVFVFMLALLVFVSSTGASVGMHLCAGEIRDISIYGSTEECPMEKEHKTTPPCHTAPESPASEKSCCEDHQFKVNQVKDATQAKDLSLVKPLDLQFSAFVYFLKILLFPSLEEEPQGFALYNPPPLIVDLQVLHQSFLI